MAVSTSVFTLTWENGKEVKLTQSDAGASAITIFNTEENGSWADWDYMASIMNNSFARKVEAIGTEMKTT